MREGLVHVVSCRCKDRGVTSQTSPISFSVIIPVKPPKRGKSRLVGLTDEARIELATGFALDAITAARDTDTVAGVLVVTDDFRFAARLSALGVRVIPDGVSEDLNGTLKLAAAEAVRQWPQAQPVALCADLPALTPAELGSALAAVPPQVPAFVADHHGIGTVLYTAPADRFDPQFGGASARVHTDYGVIPISGEWPRLRQDVDDLSDLGRAMALGVGPATEAATQH